MFPLGSRHPVQRVGVIIRAKLEGKSHILLVYQKDSKLYGFPKGQMEEEDTNEKGKWVFRKTAKRELMQETAIDLSEDELACCSTVKLHSYYYFMKDIDPMPKLSVDDGIDTKEIGALAWLPLDDIDIEKGQEEQKYNLMNISGMGGDEVKFTPTTWKIILAMKIYLSSLDEILSTKQEWNPFNTRAPIRGGFSAPTRKSA